MVENKEARRDPVQLGVGGRLLEVRSRGHLFR